MQKLRNQESEVTVDVSNASMSVVERIALRQKFALTKLFKYVNCGSILGSSAEVEQL